LRGATFDLSGLQLRVLVVDDNHNAAEAMAAYLSFENMTCRVAVGGLEAVTIGTGWAPHVILMDIFDARVQRLRGHVRLKTGSTHQRNRQCCIYRVE
jgi:CheY-like chemotaxis protein